MRVFLKCIHFLILTTALLITDPKQLQAISSLSKNDPYPVFSSCDPHNFLYTHIYPYEQDPFSEKEKTRKFNFAVSPFGQSAYRGANFHGERFLPTQQCALPSFANRTNIQTGTNQSATTTTNPGDNLQTDLLGNLQINPNLLDNNPNPNLFDNNQNTNLFGNLQSNTNNLQGNINNFQTHPSGNLQTTNIGTFENTTYALKAPGCGSSIIGPVSGDRIELGDLTGRINMLALLYGNVPDNQTLPPALQKAQTELFPPADFPLPLNAPEYIDPTERYASLTFPLKYDKRGVRFDLSADLGRGFGVNINTGVAHITQTVRKIRLRRTNSSNELTDPSNMENDLSCQAETLCNFQIPDGVYTKRMQKLLTGNFEQIAQELGVDVYDFNETSLEEIRVNAFWRHLFAINEDRETGPYVQCMPFVILSGSISPGSEKCSNKLFAASFGNDGHSAMGFSTGLNFDFVDTIEVAAEAGLTHFFSKSVHALHVPTNQYQKTLFPFTTNAQIYPGNNWHFAAKLGAHHFLDRLSTYFQYVMINHKPDVICLKNADPAFMPEILARTTAWKAKVANIGFTYDISPAIALGFLWQAPLSQKNSYRSSTIMLSCNATF